MRNPKRWRIAPLDEFGPWNDKANHMYEPTLREARKARTECARGIGLPSWEIAIYDNVTGERKE